MVVKATLLRQGWRHGRSSPSPIRPVHLLGDAQSQINKCKHTNSSLSTSSLEPSLQHLHLTRSTPPASPFAPTTPIIAKSPFESSPASASSSTNLAAPVQTQPFTTHKWTWKGHKIQYVTAGCGKPILMIHGFGASSLHFSKNIPWLAQQGYKVYAIDLLGFGGSAKPPLQYTMELWRDLVLEFMAEFIDQPVVLVGHSIGSLCTLMVNAASKPGQVRGTILFNSAGAMNNKGVLGDWRIIAVYPILALIDLLFSIPAVSAAIFKAVAKPDSIRQALKNVYMNPEVVDDQMVENFYRPSCDPGAREVFASVITGPPGPKPWKLIPDLKGALLVLWGDKDLLTPLDGPVGKMFINLPNERPDTSFKLIEGVGHCLMDDDPEKVHTVIRPWLEQLDGKAACEVQQAPVATAAATAATATAPTAAAAAAAAPA